MKIGLVLSGGIAKGAYHAGCLKAFEDRGLKGITCVSGASIGVFGAYAFAAEKVDSLCDIWEKIHFDNIADLEYNVWIKHFFRNTVDELIKKGDCLSVPVYAPICSVPIIRFEYGKMYGEYNGCWNNFVLGAAAFPVLAGGVRFYRGQVAVDGGAMDNMPILPILKNEKVDLIIALHFDATYRPRKDCLAYGKPILHFDISSFDTHRKRALDFNKETLAARIKAGYDYGNKICDLLSFPDTEQIIKEYERITEEEKDLRFDDVTFETWVKRLNLIFYPVLSQVNVRTRNLYNEDNKNNYF